jgi:prepilin peptidase CpaA
MRPTEGGMRFTFPPYSYRPQNQEIRQNSESVSNNSSTPEKSLLMESLQVAVVSWLKVNAYLVAPLILSCWMAWGDARTRRIPNYLTLATALAGLGFQFGAHGWAGLGQGFLGLCVGFALLIGLFLKGGMGAGDVKALAALGAWLGPLATLYLFIYMGLAGIPLIIYFLWRRGQLAAKAREWWHLAVNLLLLRSDTTAPSPSPPPNKSEGLPYAVALALGMVLLCWRGM